MEARKEVHFVWREFAQVEGGPKRLLVPWSDPNKHEFAFDFLFKTRQEAIEGLDTWGAKADAEENNWILCKMTLEPMGTLDTAWEPTESINPASGPKHAVSSLPVPLTTVVAEGPVRFIQEETSWGQQGWKSEVYTTPTYQDALMAFDECILFSGDFHHVFLEHVFFVREEEDGTKVMSFSSGS